MFRIDNISFRMNKRRLRASFDLPTHGIVFLEGQNGSGKSTLLRCIMGRKRYKGKILIDDKVFRGHIFSSRSHLRANIAYLSPIQQKQFFGIKFSMLINDHQFDQATIDLFRKVSLPLNTEYESLSSGERSLFHLGYALIRRRSVLIIDELLSSLSVVNQEIVSKFFDERRDQTLIIITSQKRMESFRFDAHYKIFEGRVEIIVPPQNTTGSILVNDYKKTKKGFGLETYRYLWVKLTKGLIIACLFTSLMVVFNPTYNEYKTALNDYHYLDLTQDSPPVYDIDNQTMTFLGLDFGKEGKENKLRFIASTKTGVTLDAISLFPGSTLKIRQEALRAMIETYFGFSISDTIQKKLFIGHGFSSLPQIFVTPSELLEVQKRVLYSTGEYLLPDIETLIGDESVTLLKDKDIADYLESGDPVILSGGYSSIGFAGVLNCIGYTRTEKKYTPSFAYTNRITYERYQREHLFAKPHSNNVYKRKTINLSYVSNPEKYLDFLPFKIIKLRDKLLPSFVLPTILPILFTLYLIVEIKRKRTIQECLEVDMGASFYARVKTLLKQSFKMVLSIGFLFILLALAITSLSNFAFYYSVLAMIIALPALYLLIFVIASIRSLVLTSSKG